MKLLLVLLLPLSVYAGPRDCIQKLFSGSNDLEGVHYNFDYTGDEYEDDDLANAILYIRYLLNDLGCSKKDINFAKGPLGKSKSRCRNLVPGSYNSKVCYVESNLGYFLVSKDFEDLVDITFNRWD